MLPDFPPFQKERYLDNERAHFPLYSPPQEDTGKTPPLISLYLPKFLNVNIHTVVLGGSLTI